MATKIGVDVAGQFGRAVKWAEASVEAVRELMLAEDAAQFVRYSRALPVLDGRFDSEVKALELLTQEDLEWVLNPMDGRSHYLMAL